MNFSLVDDIFQINDETTFRKFAIQIFNFQANYNPIYKKYLQYLKCDIAKINSIEDIPFMPIRFFKEYRIFCGNSNHQVEFVSSGTTSNTQSKHYISDISIYHKSLNNSFRLFYGEPSKYCILALLPSYLERSGSSLIYMIQELMQASGHLSNGFYLHNYDQLVCNLQKLENQEQPVILIGVSFALLDLARKYKLDLDNTIIMETGGMKGREREITRKELHEYLTTRLGTGCIHSEYSMTELLSQAYSRGNGKFAAPPWMHILIRDIYDPFSYCEYGKQGAINIIDLANIYSCSFIETSDAGKLYVDGTFEVLGRIDNSDIRGCNLLIE